MPEPDTSRNLGGLARSIDALFSQVPRPPGEEPPPADSEVVGAHTRPVAEAAPAEPGREPVEVIEADTEREPDPFDALEGLTTRAAEAEPGLSFADVSGPEEAVWESPEVLQGEEAAPESETVSEGQPSVEPLPVRLTAFEQSAGDLEEAVASFLSGTPGAEDEVRDISAKLRDRLELDPLADAVERLGNADGDAAVDLALEIINPAVASRLVQRMGHEEDDERRASYVALSHRLGMVMARAFRGALTGSTEARARRAYYDAMIAMGDTSRPVIEGMIEDDNRFLVRNAVAMLGEIGGERAAELVTSALANTDARVRREALGSLAKLGGQGSNQLILGLLEDPDADVRAEAAEAAGALGVERALRPILALLEEEDEPDVLVPLLHGLGRLGDPGAVQAIEKRAVGTMFSKPPTEVRVAAYRALHEIGTPHARQVIRKAHDDKDPVVRTTARGLTSAEGRGPEPPPASDQP